MELLLASVAETTASEAKTAEPTSNDAKTKKKSPAATPKTKPAKPKAARSAPATFACERCRRLHEKCDGYMPCSRCSARKKPCEYRDGIIRPPPPKMAKISDDNSLTASPNTSTTAVASPDVQSPSGGPASVTSSSSGVFQSPAAMDPKEAPVSQETFNSFVSAMTHLTAERTRALIFIDTCLRINDPNYIKWLKYQAAFLGEPSGFFSNLHTPPYESLQHAFEPVGALTSADQLCDVAEHLTILCNGAMIYCDMAVAREMSKKACEVVDRLVSEYPTRAMNDLFYRMCCTKAIIAVCFFLSGEIMDGVSIVDSVAAYTQLWEPNPISGQLLLQVHAVRWSQLGDPRDFEFCRVICRTIASVAKPWIGFLLAHGIRRVHSETQSIVQASKTLLNDVGDYPSFVAKVNRLLWEGDVRLLEVLLRAPRSILCMDAGLLEEAREHATRALSLIEALKPPGSWSIPACTAVVMKVFMHLGQTALADVCRDLLQMWAPYYPITTIWLQLIPNLYTFTQNAGFQQLFQQDDEATDWSKAAAAAGLAYDNDFGFLGPLETKINPTDY